MIETKKVTDRRKLSFARMQDILADVEALDGKDLRSSGNWTPAQDVKHVTMVIQRSLDGFEPQKAPLPLRMLMRVMRNKVLRDPFQSGIKLPAKFSYFLPDPDTTWEDAVAEMRTQVGRVADGTKMSAVSPLFGALSHEQWEQLHCRHAELHLSFIHPS